MKRFLLSILLFSSSCLTVMADDELMVKSFTTNVTDLAARNASHTDLNGTPCAVKNSNMKAEKQLKF